MLYFEQLAIVSATFGPVAEQHVNTSRRKLEEILVKVAMRIFMQMTATMLLVMRILSKLAATSMMKMTATSILKMTTTSILLVMITTIKMPQPKCF